MEGSGFSETIREKTKPGRDVSSWMFYVMILLVISLPLSEFGMSVSQFLLFGFWIFEGADYSRSLSLPKVIYYNLKRKFLLAVINPLLLIFIAVYLFHVLGLLYSADLDYGLKDLRVKLPLLTFPVMLATSSPLNTKKLNIILLFFALSVLAGSLISTVVYLTGSLGDPREMSIFISHIRFSLFVAMSIYILIGFVRFNSFKSRVYNITFLGMALWLIVFLLILKSSTGLIITVILFMTIISLSALNNKSLLIPGTLIILLILAGFWLYIRDIYRDLVIAEPITYANHLEKTAKGNLYEHDTINYGIENGRYVGSYLAVDEMRESWNKRSSIDYDSLDKKGQQLSYTLIRYLHSKGLKKDAEGVNKLSDKEIAQIENGVTSSSYLNELSPRSYFEQLLMGFIAYTKNNNPNASSFMQRIEYWKTSIYLIKKQPIGGYGTGDVKNAFDRAYVDTHSNLLPEFRHRSHNQFFAITVAMGIIGLLVFVIALFYPPLRLWKFNNYYYLIFFLVAMLSFLTEDTLETQPGATFFGFFSALFLFGITKEADFNAPVFSNND